MSGEEHLPAVATAAAARDALIREAHAVFAAFEAGHAKLAELERQGVPGVRYSAAYRLRGFLRRLHRAQVVCVLPGDERYGACQQRLEDLERLERTDAPWRSEERAA